MHRILMSLVVVFLPMQLIAQEINDSTRHEIESAYAAMNYDQAAKLISEVPRLLGVIPLLDQPKSENRAQIFFDLARIRFAQNDTAQAHTILDYVFALDPNSEGGVMDVGGDTALDQTKKRLALMRQRQRQSELAATTFWGAAGRSMVFPGWGHLYKGRKKRAYVFMGATAAAAIYWFVADRNYKKAYNTYRSTQIGELNLDQRSGAGTDSNPFQTRFEKAELKANSANVALGILAGIWLAGVFDHAVVGPAQLSVELPIF